MGVRLFRVLAECNEDYTDLSPLTGRPHRQRNKAFRYSSIASPSVIIFWVHKIEISRRAIDMTIPSEPQRTRDVAPAGFEPATHGLGNRRSIP